MRRLLPLALAVAVSACCGRCRASAAGAAHAIGSPTRRRRRRTTRRAGIVRVGAVRHRRGVRPPRLHLPRRARTASASTTTTAGSPAPAGMIADLIARDLAASRAACGGAAGPVGADASDYELSGRDREARRARRPAAAPRTCACARSSVRIDVKGPRRCSSRTSSPADQPCTPGDPTSFAEAMSQAAQDVSTQVVARVVAAAVPQKSSRAVQKTQGRRQKAQVPD